MERLDTQLILRGALYVSADEKLPKSKPQQVTIKTSRKISIKSYPGHDFNINVSVKALCKQHRVELYDQNREPYQFQGPFRSTPLPFSHPLNDRQ